MKPYNERLPLIDAAIDYFIPRHGGYPSKCQYMVEFNPKSHAWCATDCSDNYLFTQDEFNQRKAERQNKPKWVDAPEWANWLAQDANGQWVWCKARPYASPANKCWNRQSMLKWSSSLGGNVFGNWQDTLEKRPFGNVVGVINDVEFSRQSQSGTIERIKMEKEFEKEQAMKNDWYEKGDRPPVGSECEFKATSRCNSEDFASDWEVCRILYIGKNGGAVVKDKNGDECFIDELDYDLSFRPLPTEIDKLVGQAKLDIGAFFEESDIHAIKELIAKGWRPNGADK